MPGIGEACMPGQDLMGLQPREKMEQQITISRHKQLTALAYRVKEFIDQEGGLNTNQERCMFGDMMARIVELK